MGISRRDREGGGVMKGLIAGTGGGGLNFRQNWKRRNPLFALSLKMRGGLYRRYIEGQN